MAEWLDISQEMALGMPVWPGDPALSVRPIARIGEGGAVSNVSEWSFSSHAGTHVDPPLHFVPGGPGVDRLNVNLLCGPCRVLDLSAVEGHIPAAALEEAGGWGEARLLLKTRNSARQDGTFHEDFTAITPEAAAWLVAHGVRLIGTDGPSIEAFDTLDFSVHHTLLENGVIVVEGLALAEVAAGRYEMACAPLKWKDADGAPARVLLRALPAE
jgi:arylformamidase